jgi:molybdopterin synthase catalytic subunit
MSIDLKHTSASVDAYQEIPEGICAITHAPLDIGTIIRAVGDDAAGGTAVFIGTTRNSFKGIFVRA